MLNARRIHGDDTTVPVLAKGKIVTGRLWTYVRDDRPFGGPDPPAAVYDYSRSRDGEHPRRHLADYGGILHADAFAGFNALYDPSRTPGPITEAACWAGYDWIWVMTGLERRRIEAGDEPARTSRGAIRHERGYQGCSASPAG